MPPHAESIAALQRELARLIDSHDNDVCECMRLHNEIESIKARLELTRSDVQIIRRKIVEAVK